MYVGDSFHVLSYWGPLRACDQINPRAHKGGKEGAQGGGDDTVSEEGELTARVSDLDLLCFSTEAAEKAMLCQDLLRLLMEPP